MTDPNDFHAKIAEERDALKAEVDRLRDSRTRHLETETKLVAEVERLTRGMAQLQRFKWNDEQMRLADARAEAAERERDIAEATYAASILRAAGAEAELDHLLGRFDDVCAEHSDAIARAEAAERKLAKMKDALHIALSACPADTARRALAELEKADG